MMTEEEAKTRWCPFVQVATAPTNSKTKVGVILNRDISEFVATNLVRDTCKCIASVCMAWRWRDDEDGNPAYETTPVKDSPGHFDHAPTGYCGLAGKP